ncbi:MAG: hypothetical protein ACSHX4_09560 [Opitutaceae bacterium]
MKTTYIISLIAAALFFAGCASNKTATSEPAPQAAPTGEAATAKTAYEGSTGSGLLMERYKSGSIEGYRD